MKMVTRLALLAFAVSLASPVQATVQQEAIRTKRSEFRIPFTFEKEEYERLGVQEVQLFLSMDHGQSWQHVQSALPTSQKFRYKTQIQGEHWFAVRTLDRNRQLHPQGKLTPGLKVLVDTQEPEVSMQLGEMDGGRVKVMWHAADADLKPSSMRLEYKEADSTEWNAASFVAGRSGEAVISTSGHDQVVVRLGMRDRAGNVGAAERILHFKPAAPIAVTPAPMETRVPLETRAPSMPAPLDPPYEPDTTSQFVSSQAPAMPAGVPVIIPGVERNPIRTQVTVPAVNPVPVVNPVPTVNPEPIPRPVVAARPAPTAVSVPAPMPIPSAAYTQSASRPHVAVPAPAPAAVPQHHVPDHVVGPYTIPHSSQLPGQLAARTVPAPIAPARTMSIPTMEGPAAGQQLTLPQAPVNPPEPDIDPTLPRIVNQLQFRLDYALEDTGPSGLSSIDVFITEDGGRKWWRYGEDRDKQSPVILRVPRDGTYGFVIAAKSGVGLGDPPPAPGDAPHAVVVVDRTPPKARFDRIGVSEDGRTLSVNWKTSDGNAHPQPVRVEYAETPAGPWTPMSDWQADTGELQWNVPAGVPSRVHVRMLVRDAAENMGQIVYPQSVLVDMSRPRARITNVKISRPRQ